MSADSAFEDVVRTFAREKTVTHKTSERGFGSRALLVHGKIFATLARGGLLLKLPKGRVERLIDDGIGEAFDAGRGRVMREWVVVAPRHAGQWAALAKEALAFVGAATAGKRPSR